MVAREETKKGGRVGERKGMKEEGHWQKEIEEKKKQRKGHGCKREQRKKVSAK